MYVYSVVSQCNAFIFQKFFLIRYFSAMTETTFRIRPLKKKPRQVLLTKEDVEKLSREELVDKVLNLEARNHQLKNILSKKEPNYVNNGSERKFDFSKVSKRHVFLKLYYLGWDFHGSVSQENTTETVENYLFNALQKCCLIESRETSNYHICGRTDKGVSAFSQVVSLDLRSKLETPDEKNVNDELPYCMMLNRTLPKSIKCYAWCHVGSTISARFDCSSRTYKYYFPKGNLNVEAMQKGADYLIGIHDFRNFCKMNVKNAVTNFVREISLIKINPFVSDASLSSGFEMLELIIKGKSFLWNQIRCIMTVLLLIGQERESPEVIKELLNIDKNPRKPQYAPASEFPLNLYSVDYHTIPTIWNVDETDLTKTIKFLLSQWTDYSTKSLIIKDMIENLQKLSNNPIDIKNVFESLRYDKNKPLMLRMKCESLENRISHFIKRKKIEAVETEDSSNVSLSNGS